MVVNPACEHIHSLSGSLTGPTVSPSIILHMVTVRASTFGCCTSPSTSIRYSNLPVAAAAAAGAEE
jgi:hypothetical protein